MQFIDYLNKLKIKLLAPSIVCYRQLGSYRSELKYWAFHPAYLVLKDQPIGNDGYYKTVYVNNKRIKPSFIIPRNAFIEIRQKPENIKSWFSSVV